MIQAKKEKLHEFYRDLSVSFVGSLRALSLYPREHPETQKKLRIFFQRLSKYLEQRSTISLIVIGGEIIVENTPLPELTNTLSQFIRHLELLKLQRVVFRRGLTIEELIRFLQLLLSLFKNPGGADLALSRSQERLPHILAGSLPFDTEAHLSYEEVATALHAARQSIFPFAGQLKDLFTDMEGPLTESEVSIAKEMTETIYRMVETGEMPLKILIYRRSSDPDPYIHAINVSALSMALAQQHITSESHIYEVGLGGLLHDIGLHLTTPASTKIATLTLDEKRRQWEHPLRGAEILLATPGIPDLVPIITYEHHLHYDGGGYPKQEYSRQLNIASMIIFITNTYDNLRRSHPKRNVLSLTEALNWMDLRAGALFHPLLLKQFRALVKGQAGKEV